MGVSAASKSSKMDSAPDGPSAVFGNAAAISARLITGRAATPVMEVPHSSEVPVASPGPEAAAARRLLEQICKQAMESAAKRGSEHEGCVALRAGWQPLFARHELPLTAKPTGALVHQCPRFAAARGCSSFPAV